MKCTQKIKQFIKEKDTQYKTECAEFSKKEILTIALGAGCVGVFINRNLFGNRFKLKDLRSLAILTSMAKNRSHQKKGEVYKDVVNLFGGDIEDVPDNVVLMLKDRGDDIEDEVLNQFRQNICEELGISEEEAYYIQRR